MYSRVIKNYKVYVGTPFDIKTTFTSNESENIQKKDTDYVVENNDYSCEGPENLVVNDEKSEYSENSVSVDEILIQAKSEASIIIKEAEDEARRILEKVKEEARKSAEEIEQAKIKGYNDAYNEAKAKYMSLVAEMETIKSKVIEEYNKMLENAEAEVVEIILDISRKVLQSEITQNKDYIFNLVREAINGCTHKEDLILRVSPEEYDYITQKREVLDSIFSSSEKMEIIKDSSLKEGDCIIETPYGSVETGVQLKLSKIEETFLGLLNTGSEAMSYLEDREEKDITNIREEQ